MFSSSINRDILHHNKRRITQKSWYVPLWSSVTNVYISFTLPLDCSSKENYIMHYWHANHLYLLQAIDSNVKSKNNFKWHKLNSVYSTADSLQTIFPDYHSIKMHFYGVVCPFKWLKLALKQKIFSPIGTTELTYTHTHFVFPSRFPRQ